VASPASSAANDKLNRLLKLQQLSDEDLIRRAVEVQQDDTLREGLGPGSGAGRAAATTAAAATALADSIYERRLMDAHLLRSGVGGGVGGLLRFQPGLAGRAGATAAAAMAAAAERNSRGKDNGRHHRLDIDMIRQAYIDTALARGDLGHGGGPPSDYVSNNIRPGGHPAESQPSKIIQQQQQPLRYFNNGMEVDMEGNPLPITNSGSVTSMSTAALPQGLMGSLATKKNNVISMFLMTVIRRVPEIGPALAVLVPEDCDPALIASEFQSVVEAAAMVLRSVQERCARLTDDFSIDLHRRITACITLIEANSADIDLGVPGARVGERPGSVLAPPPPMDVAMRHAHLLRLGIDPNTYQNTLLSNNHRLDLAGGSAGAAGGSGLIQYPSPEEQLAMVHHHRQQQASVILYQSGVLQEGNAAYASLKKNNDVPLRVIAKSESPVDDNLPIMTMYKSEKKAAKTAMKAEKRKRKPKLVHKANALLKTFDAPPKKLVQHALFSGGFDPNVVAESNGSLDRSHKRKTLVCPTASDPSKESGGSSTKSDNAKDCPSAEGITSDMVDERISQPTAKKLCLADKSNANGYNKGGSGESIPVSNMKQKNGKVEKSGKEKNDNKHGPHGDVLEKLFDDGAKPSADKGEANEAESESSAGNESKKKSVRIGGPPKSNEATGKLGKPSSREVALQPVKDAGGGFDANDPLPQTIESSVVTKDSVNQATTGLDGHFGAVSVLLGLMGK
jgi:hypothetical protein